MFLLHKNKFIVFEQRKKNLAQDTLVARLSNMGLNTKIKQPKTFLSRKGNL